MKKIIFLSVITFATATAAFAEFHLFPVPYVESKHSSQGISFVFDDVATPATLKIYTINGEEVFRHDVASGEASFSWKPVVNSSGKKVASGVYIYLLDAQGQQTTGKLVVIR